MTDAGVGLLRSHKVPKAPSGAFELVPTTAMARAMNTSRLVLLKRQTIAYMARDSSRVLHPDHASALLDSVTTAEVRLELCVGAAVLLLVNCYFDSHGVCAGARGEVVGLYDRVDEVGGVERLPEVLISLPSGTGTRRVRVPRQLFNAMSLDSSCEVSASKSQVPLLLGWALTIHKAQGMTLDRAALSLVSVFTFSKVYVSSSSLRQLADVLLLSFDPSRVTAIAEALHFHDSLDPL